MYNSNLLQAYGLDLFSSENQWLFISTDSDKRLPLEKVVDGANIAMVQEMAASDTNENCLVSGIDLSCFHGFCNFVY